MSDHPISKAQIKMIHTLKSKLSMTDETYRTLLSQYRKRAVYPPEPAESSKDLAFESAKQLIAFLNDLAAQTTDWVNHSHSRFESVSRRPGFASKGQLEKIWLMWKRVSWAKTDRAMATALDLFIFRKFERGGLMMVEAELVPKIVKAIDEMQKQQDRKKVRSARQAKERRVANR